MLTDAALTHLKPKEKAYKVSDRDGMYVRVGTNGTISFRLDYRLNGRRETVTFGKCGPSDLSLARAREKCIDAKRMVQEGLSPSIEKQRDKRRIKEARVCGLTPDDIIADPGTIRTLAAKAPWPLARSEEHTSELQSLMRTS